MTALQNLVSPVPVSIEHWYVQWSGWTGGGNCSGYHWSDPKPCILATLAKGRIPMITWEAFGTPNANPTGADDFPLANIAAGAYDTYIDEWIAGAKLLPAQCGCTGTLYMRVFHEPNYGITGPYPWAVSAGAGYTGAPPETYVAAWRHIVLRFKAAGATNVKWILNPGADLPNNPFPAAAYPGDDVIDFMGWDAYPNQAGSTVAQDFNAVCAVKCSKPWLLGEASGPPSWVSQQLAPAVRLYGMAVVWFDEQAFSVQSTGSANAIKTMMAP